MKKSATIILLLVLCMCSCVKDNNDNLSTDPWYHLFDGQIGQLNYSTIVSSDGHLIICGHTNGSDTWILKKATKSGTELWTKYLPPDSAWRSNCALTEAPNGDLFICGSAEFDMSPTGRDIFIMKTNPQGDPLWTKTYGTQDYEHGQNIINTSDEKVLISGSTYPYDSIARNDIILIKLEPNGDTIWTRRFNLQEGDDLLPFHLLETQDGSYLITGSNNYGPLGELYLLKVDPGGTKIWERIIGPPTGKSGVSALELINGDLLICGENESGSQILLVKTDETGNLIWEREYGSANTVEYGYSIQQNLDGSYTILGKKGQADIIDPEYGILLMKIDETGNEVWTIRFGNSEYDRGINLIKDTNDDNLVTGELVIDGVRHIFLSRIDKDGNFK